MKEVNKYEDWTLEEIKAYSERLQKQMVALDIKNAERRGAMAAMKQTHQAEMSNIESLSSLDGFKVMHFDWDLFESDILKERAA